MVAPAENPPAACEQVDDFHEVPSIAGPTRGRAATYPDRASHSARYEPWLVAVLIARGGAGRRRDRGRSPSGRTTAVTGRPGSLLAGRQAVTEATRCSRWIRAPT